MVLEILQFWIVIQVLGLVGLPLTRLLFRSLPDQGYAFSKSLGLLLTGYGAWLLAMFGLGSFGVPLLLIVATAIGLGGFLLQRSRNRTSGEASTAPLLTLISWRRILAYEALFLLALVAMALMRATYVDFFAPNPNPWFTERPMDFAFFNAIQQSAVFPPQDPWLAGFSINYYYFGYLLMATVTMLSGVSPGVGYNLALALIVALTALGIAGIVVNLIDLTLRKADETLSDEANAPHRPRLAAFITRPLVVLITVLLVLVVGNQSGALQVIIGSERVVALDDRQMVSALSQAISGAPVIELPYPVNTFDFSTFSRIERSDKVADFNWWWPSRALWDEHDQQRRYTITEFPFFSFWLGDMHPHVMALPFGLLALALALTTLARPTATIFALSRRGWIELVLTGIVLGSLYTINSWDLPSYLLLYLAALLLLFLRLADGQFSAVQWGYLGRQALLVVLALFILFVPFHLTFRSLVGSAAPLVDLPLIGRLTQVIAPYIDSKTDLHAFLGIFGLFVVPLIAFVYLALQRPARPAEDEGDVLAFVAQSPTAALRLSSFDQWLPWIPPLLLLVGLLAGFPLLALLGLGLLAFRQAMLRAAQPAESMVLLVLALGCAICFGTELIYIRDVFSNRMNTIFKFYYQVWLLWGTLAAYALWWLLMQTGRLRRIVVAVTSLLFLLLLAGGLVYPTINLRNMVAKGDLVGLEGKTPREESAAGRESIRWLRQNAEPGSVVLEMAEITLPDGSRRGGSYNGEGYSGVAASTGLPTIIGWIGHQQQWRGGDKTALDELEPRQQAVDLIYSTADLDQARELLQKYNVRYVYIGALERQNYSAESLAKFAQLGQVVFYQDDIIIYKLLP